MSTRFLLIAGVATVLAVAGGWGVGQFRKTGTAPPPAADRGPVLYQIYCAGCHGPEGRGDGTVAHTLKPPPRSFSARPWRGALTEDAVRKVIIEGLPGTPMPSNPSLSESEVNALSAYVLKLASLPTESTPVASPESQLLRDANFVDLHGTRTPALTVVDAKGETIRLADLKGKLVLLHFWATNCVHCVKEFPQWKALEVEYAPRDLVVLHVCIDAEDAADAQAQADRAAAGLRILTDPSGLARHRFDVQALPTVWLVGPQGEAFGSATGAADRQGPQFRALLERWLP